MCGPGTRCPDGWHVSPRGPERVSVPVPLTLISLGCLSSFSKANTVFTWLPWLCVTEDTCCLETFSAVTARGRVLLASRVPRPAPTTGNDPVPRAGRVEVDESCCSSPRQDANSRRAASATVPSVYWQLQAPRLVQSRCLRSRCQLIK